jgi:2-amino-4-hydroxy-6-hydroxymethyldihydropteridine diphosphokinase
MTQALISFGANLAERNADLTSVLHKVPSELKTFKGIDMISVSRGFRTPAWPPGSGPDFLNAAMRIETSLSPEELMAALHRIERGMGRTRPVRWGPRVCDLDLLIYGDRVIPDRATVERWMAMDDDEAIRHLPDRLLVPHPRLHRRGFVLLPLLDIAPEWRHPILGRTVAEMAARLDDAAVEGVRPV